VLRERTIVLALVVQLFVAAFSTFLAVGLVALYQPGSVGTSSQMDIAYAGGGGFGDVLEQRDSLNPVAVEPREGLEAFRSGEVDAFALEPEANASQPQRVQLWVPEGEVQSTLLVNELKSALDDYEHELRQERSDRLERDVLRVEGPDDVSVAFDFAYGVLLPLLVAVPVFLSGGITADSLSDEINEGTLTLLRASPLSSAEVAVGKMLTPILLVPAQVALWMGLMWANGLPTAAPGAVFAIALAAGALVCSIGLLVGAMARREGPTQAAYTLVMLAVGGLSLLLPQDPANLIARAGVGALNAQSYLTIAIYVALALLAGATAINIVGDRMAADRLQPGVA
jgi:ABC-type Na+ efflux pump permease subunit